MNDTIEEALENLELAERFAVALRFHDQQDRAEAIEELAAKMRAEAMEQTQ
jgi:hypothetical protein